MTRRPADSLPDMDVPAAFATDTDAMAHRLMVAKWRAMTMAERVATIDALQHDCNALAVAGIREAEPEASPDRTRYLLAVRRYGRRLADEVYGRDRS
jgi:hypothetical protein